MKINVDTVKSFTTTTNVRLSKKILINFHNSHNFHTKSVQTEKKTKCYSKVDSTHTIYTSLFPSRYMDRYLDSSGRTEKCTVLFCAYVSLSQWCRSPQGCAISPSHCPSFRPQGEMGTEASWSFFVAFFLFWDIVKTAWPAAVFTVSSLCCQGSPQTWWRLVRGQKAVYTV